MLRRILSFGPAPSPAALRVAGAAGLALDPLPPGSGSDPGAVARRARDGGYDAVCALAPPGDTAELAAACGRAGVSALLAGPPADDLAALERVEAAFSGQAARLAAGGLVAANPANRAIVLVAAQRRVGAPVYLRYAAEAGRPDSLLWRAADAIDFAAEALGAPADVYATGVERAGALVHLALTVCHRDGSVALLDLGVGGEDNAPGTYARGHASLLLLGDRGAAEAHPAGGGAVVGDGQPAPAATPLRDEYAAAVAGWLAQWEALLGEASGPQAARRRVRRLVGAGAAVRRSLVRGRPEAVMSDE